MITLVKLIEKAAVKAPKINFTKPEICRVVLKSVVRRKNDRLLKESVFQQKNFQVYQQSSIPGVAMLRGKRGKIFKAEHLNV